jgi:hypothetical protein
MKTFLGILSIVIAAVISGTVLMVLWGWFIVPLGVPAIRVVHGIGIAITVSFLTHQVSAERKDPDFAELLVQGIVYDLVCLGIGFFAHLAM